MSTPLNIKDPEAYQLARQIADHTGKSLTRVVVDALRHERERVMPRNVDRSKLREILSRAHALPDLDARPAAELFSEMYDENGLIR